MMSLQEELSSTENKVAFARQAFNDAVMRYILTDMLEDEYEHGFAVDWMRKDLAIVMEESRRNGARLPVTALVDQFYADVQAMGGGRWDTSSLLRRLQNRGRDIEH